MHAATKVPAHQSLTPPPRSSSSMPAVIMPEGRATTATPMSEESMGDCAPNVAGRVQVSVADGRQGDDRPVHGVEEGIESFRLDVEDHEGTDEDVANSEAEDGEQRLPLLLEHGGDGGSVFE